MKNLFFTENRNKERKKAAEPTDEVCLVHQRVRELEMYRSLFDQSPTAQLILDPQMIIEKMNHQANVLFAAGQAAPLGKTIDSILPDDIEKVSWALTELASIRDSRRLFLTWKKEGSLNDWEAVLTPLRFSKEEEMRVLMTIREAVGSGKERHQAGRHPTLHPFHILQNQLFRIAKRSDGEYIYVFSEGKIAESFDRTTERVYGKPVRDVTHEKHVDLFIQSLDRAFSGEEVNFEQTCNGRVFSTQLSPVHIGQTIPEVVGLVTEITEQRLIEHRLEEAHLLFAQFAEESLFAVSIFTANDPSLVYANKRMAEMFGYSSSEIKGSEPLKYIHPDDRELALEMLAKRSKGEKEMFHYQLRGLHKDGRTLELEVMSKGMWYKGKESIVVMALDVSQRKQADEIVRKSEMLTMIGQLAAGVAHEIRNPLTSIKGFLQLIQMEGGIKGKTKYYEIMLAELERIEFIISEFLVLAKPQLVKRSHKNIVNLLQNIIILVETHAIINNVQIFLQVEKNLPTIMCEENQLKQAFINVMKNAIEAMPDGGELLITVMREGNNQLLIQFIDQGVGVPEEIMPKLGEPFYTTKEKGTGLGLMVCYKIIEDHQGNITVKSKANAGTTVEIRLPVGS